jgi:hypothetical protein
MSQVLGQLDGKLEVRMNAISPLNKVRFGRQVIKRGVELCGGHFAAVEANFLVFGVSTVGNKN